MGCSYETRVRPLVRLRREGRGKSKTRAGHRLRWQHRQFRFGALALRGGGGGGGQVLYKGQHTNPINFFQRDLNNRVRKTIEIWQSANSPAGLIKTPLQVFKFLLFLCAL